MTSATLGSASTPMPTYAYRCGACGHEFDAVQSFHDDPLTLCPNCGESAARRVFRSVGVIFKGSGWYVNDTRGEPGRRRAAAANADETSSAPGEAAPEPAAARADAPATDAKPASDMAPRPAKPAEPAGS